MPDITMCKNDSCPIRLSCHRHSAIPSLPNQSYQIFHPTYDEQTHFVDCDSFMPVIYDGHGKKIGYSTGEEKKDV